MDVSEIKIDEFYKNKLNMDYFTEMLDNPSQCYKFYWFEAIVSLLPENDVLTFREIITEMIWEAWYTVAEYHLRLGPVINGKAENYIEHAINILANDTEVIRSREEYIQLLDKNFTQVKQDFVNLTKYVPYRLLSSFFRDLNGNDRMWDQKNRMIAYMEELNNRIILPYTISRDKGLSRRVKVNPTWKKLILDNYSVIKGWIQVKKVHYLQDRNPNVPGIIYKLGMEQRSKRNLERVRDLWLAYSSVTGNPIINIYDSSVVSNQEFSLDHFVPWSYISNDELWDLTPMSRSQNSSKGNKLPDWDRFFPLLAKNQYCLYDAVFHFDNMRTLFDKCRPHNLNTIWAAEELYVPGNTESKFINILEKNMRPIYDNARLQGFSIW